MLERKMLQIEYFGFESMYEPIVDCVQYNKQLVLF